MKFKHFLESSTGEYTDIQELFIKSWGKLLYLDYLSLPNGGDESQKHADEYKKLIAEYPEFDAEELVDIEEWVGAGGKLKVNGKTIYLFSRATINAVFKSALRPANSSFILYRFNQSDNTITPNSWISTSKKPEGYSGNMIEIEILRGDPIIDTRGLADDNEVIISTNLYIKRIGGDLGNTIEFF